MIFLFYFFSALQILLGIQSLKSGFAFRGFFRKELARPASEFAPFVTIFLPCRGIDESLLENLRAICRQDYPKFEVIFIVDSLADDATKIIKKVVRENPQRARLKESGKSSGESQKTHNLREAIKQIQAETEVFVFTDSDARTSENWLKNLVAPLADARIGAATGYRWFVQKRGNLPTFLRAAWNASITSALGADAKNNFCWGGATAIRREVFEKLEISENWRGKLSSDYPLTNALKEASLPIYFVPQCLTASIEDTNWGDFWEFTNRQMKLTQVYSPSRFKISLIGALIFSLTFWTGVFLLFLNFGNSHSRWILAILFVIFILGAWKSHIRFETVKIVLQDYKDELGKQRVSQMILWIFAPLVFLYNDVRALLSEKIKWRGIEYILHSPEKTEIISRKNE